MNDPTRQQTEHALELWRGGAEGFNYGHIERLASAAEAWLRLAPVTCPDKDCEGGTYWNYAPPGIGESMPCRACDGSGSVPPPNLIDKIAQAIGACYSNDPENDQEWMERSKEQFAEEARAVWAAIERTET